MKEKIGKVVLDYEKYPGKDLYSDGDIEEVLLEIVKNFKEEDFNQIIWEHKSWPILYHLSHIRGNVVEWIPFKPGASVLEIGSGCGAITGTLAKKAERVVCIELSERRSLINAYRNSECDNIEIKLGNFGDVEAGLTEKFDYIMLIGVLEYAGLYVQSANPYDDFLSMVSRHLKPDGKIVVAIENRLGLKYWSGYQEDHLGGFFKSLEGYTREDGVRTFSRKELLEIARRQGFVNSEIYYPYPDYKLPSTIYSDDYLPKVGELSPKFRNYDRDRLVLFNEEKAFDALISSGLFGEFSNSFVMIMQKEEEKDKKIFVKYSNERARRYCIKTEIRTENGKNVVVKTPCNHEAEKHIQELSEHYKKLENMYTDTNVQLNRLFVENDEIKFDFLQGESLEEKMDELLNEGKADECVEWILEYASVFRQPCDKDFEMTEAFENVFGKVELPAGLKTAECSDVDLVFSNIIIKDDVWHLLDYEWTFDFMVPLNYILYRSVSGYLENAEWRGKCLNEEKIYELLEIAPEERRIYRQMEANFQRSIGSSIYTLDHFAYTMCKRKIDIHEILKDDLWGITEYNVQIFWKNGEEFSEEKSLMMEPVITVDDSLLIGFEVPEKCDGVRIDPGIRCCRIRLMEFVDDKGNELSFADNGIHLEDDTIVYLTDDPQMVVNAVFEKGTRISLKIKIDFIKMDLSKKLLKVFDAQESKIHNKEIALGEQQQLLAQKEKEIESIQEIAVNREQVINAIENSISWKITKPIRAFKRMLRRGN